VGKIIFLSKTASTELCKTGDSVNLEKTTRYTRRKKHNGIGEMEFL